MMQKDELFHKDPRQLSKQDLIEVYEILSPRLFRYAFRLLGEPDLAEDCVHETFSRFLKALSKGFGPREHVQAYMYRIAHNWIMDYYRNRKPEEDLNYNQLMVTSESTAVAAIRNMESEQVREALLNLSDEHRQVILLRFYEELSHEETAAAIGKTVEATRAIQVRALNGLRKLLITVGE